MRRTGNTLILRIALTLLPILVASTAHAGFMTGVNAYLKGDYETALLEWAENAKDGDSRAMAYIGYLYFGGMGIPRDDARALEWFEKAAEHGDPDAIATMARMYAHGWSVKKDMDKAFGLMDRVKDADNYAAQMVASEFYENGFGTEVNLDRALEHANRLPTNELGMDLAGIRQSRIDELERKKAESGQ